MIVITTPTGQVGSQLVARLLASKDPVRVIVRDASRLDASVRERVEVVEGSHDDPAVLDQALPGAAALFWLVPPNPLASSAEAHYLDFARAGAEAIRATASATSSASQAPGRLVKAGWSLVGRFRDGCRARALGRGVPGAQHAVLHGEHAAPPRHDP